MFGKIKRIFFTGMFGVLYISFAAQLIYVLGFVNNLDSKFIAMGFLALEWVILIAARFLSKKSATGSNQTYNNNHRRY